MATHTPESQDLMTVGQLIAELQEFDPSLPIVCSRPSGDYWHTTIGGVIGSPEVGAVKWSDYHQQFAVVDNEGGDPPEEAEEGQHMVVVI